VLSAGFNYGYLLIIFAILLGISASTLWVAHGDYLTVIIIYLTLTENIKK
jgi:hypothetical protein